MTPISVWLPLRVQCICLVAGVIAVVVGITIAIALAIDWFIATVHTTQ